MNDFRSINSKCAIHPPDRRTIRCLRRHPGGAVQTEHIAWCAATLGQRFNLIVLDREPRDDHERTWLTDVLPTRLAPGGRIVTADDAAATGLRWAQ